MATDQQLDIRVHGAQQTQWPVHGGLLPPHGGKGGAGIGPVHGLNGNSGLSPASIATLSTVNGLNKNSNVTVNGLTLSAVTGSGTIEVRSAPEMVGTHAQFEITLGASTTGAFEVGIDDGTTNLNSTSGPGVSNAAGISIRFINSGQITVFWNSAGNSFDFSTTAGVVAGLDTFTYEFDRTAHTLLCFRTRSGVTTQIGGTCTGLPTLSHNYVFGGSINATVSGIFNFGATPFAKTPGAGVDLVWA